MPWTVRPHRETLLEAAWLLALTGLAIWLRWPALGTEGFHNEDAAGITYNADLLRHGLLPLVDAVELKAPGSFWATWLSWGLFGRSIAVLQKVMCAWAIVGMLGVYACGRLLYGRRAGGVAALLFCVFAPITDSIDINYGAWMAPAYIWSTAFFVLAAKSGRLRWLVMCGATLALAGLLKRQAAVLFPLFAALLLIGPRLARPEGWAEPVPWRKGLAALFGGLAIGFSPIALLGGDAIEFGRHYFFSEGGWRYLKGELDWGDKLARVGDGVLGLWEYMATVTLLAAATAVMVCRTLTWRGALLGGHLVLSFIGAAIGFRFFKGYYLQLLPAAVWVAAHSEGPLTRWFSRGSWRGPGTVFALVGVLFLSFPGLYNDLGQLSSIRKRRATARDLDAQRIARVVKANTEADDTIWVWGRWAWPVYFHADRMSASPYYKVLGILTTNLTNTWKRETERTRFIEDGPWEEVIADLEEEEPAFIVLAHNEDYSDFEALKALIRADYRRVPNLRVPRFSIYYRKDHVLTDPPKARGRKKPRAKPRKPVTAKAPKTAGRPLLPGLKPPPAVHPAGKPAKQKDHRERRERPLPKAKPAP